MIYAIVFAFILLDFVTGLIKAFATSSFSSTKMREGLFHKSGLILVILLGVLVDYAQGYLELGLTLPVAGSVCTYISLMETGSILENVCEINPQLLPTQLRQLFGGLSGLENNDTGGDDPDRS